MTAPQAAGLRWIQKDILACGRSEPGLSLTFPSKEQGPNLSWAPAVGQLILPLLFILYKSKNNVDIIKTAYLGNNYLSIINLSIHLSSII